MTPLPPSFPHTATELCAACTLSLCYEDVRLDALLAVAHSSDGLLKALLSIPRVDARRAVAGLLSCADRVTWARACADRAAGYAAAARTAAAAAASYAAVVAADAAAAADADADAADAAEHRTVMAHAVELLCTSS